MKYFEEMNPLRREIVILKAVLGSSYIEGMKDAAGPLEKELEELEEEYRKKVGLKLAVG